MNIGVYATYTEVKEYLSNRAVDKLTVDDNIIKQFCIRASRRFDRYCNRKFYPTLETNYYDHPNNSLIRSSSANILRPSYNVRRLDIGAPQLLVKGDLLEIISLYTNNGSQQITSSDYILKRGDAIEPTPYDRIELKLNGSITNFNYTGTPQNSNIVTGWWGFHNDWANAFQLVDTVQDNPLAVGSTSVTVADVDGVDERGLNPRFRSQQLIRFGSSPSSEIAYITNVNVDNNQLTIVRGVNGTTAAEQAQNTGIYVFRPLDDVVDAVLLMSSYSYRRKDTIGTVDDRTVASPTGVMLLPSTLPSEVRDLIDAYKARY